MIELIESLRSHLIETFGVNEMRRICGLLDILAGVRVPALAPQQQLALPLFVPDLSDAPWIDVTGLPWAAELENAYPMIRDEMQAVLAAPDAPLQPYGPAYDSIDGSLPANVNVPGWNAYYFYRAGRRVHGSSLLCPRTAAALENLPVGQEALFSVLDPGAHIPEHSDGLNFFMTCHLGLEIPEGCEIRVASTRYRWREGRCLLINTSFLHEAWNPSDRRRVVLLVDVWHPDLTPSEIAALSSLRPQVESLFALAPRATEA